MHLTDRINRIQASPTAAVIAAGLDGIDRQLEPGEPHNYNHYTVPIEELLARGVRVLPQSLGEALGADFLAEFVRLKHMEWVEYQRHVSQWEVERYFEFF